MTQSRNSNENPCLSPAWLGYKIDPYKGDVIWRVCGWCPPNVKKPVEQEAKRLNIRVTHGMCPACYKRQTGEELPGILSEQPAEHAQ